MLNKNPPVIIALRYYPITVTLITICVIVFLLQLINGVDVANPKTSDLIRWGANLLPLTLGNEPYRMITSLFLHIGFLHLMFNTFALYYFGQVAEQIFGKIHFLLLFLLAGIGGNLLNNYLGWQDIIQQQSLLPTVSAGASGGIMGIGMALIMSALLKMRVNQLQLNLSTLTGIMIINLSIGFIFPGIDNAGHIGGAITGTILGLGYAIAYRLNTHWAKLFQIAMYAVLLIGFITLYLWLHLSFTQFFTTHSIH